LNCVSKREEEDWGKRKDRGGREKEEEEEEEEKEKAAQSELAKQSGSWLASCTASFHRRNLDSGKCIMYKILDFTF
jgi:hypothetical protein